MECDPTARLDIQNCAIPELKTAVPIVLLPPCNVTLPVAAAGETLTVKVTSCP
jgi:hypothetical protein